MTNSFDELEQASCLFVIGSNTTVAHPMVGMRLMHCHREGGKLIVADPRRTDLARLADVHLRLRPGTDVPLVNGLMHIIYENGWHDAAFIAERTENFDELRESLREWTPERTEEVTGVPRELLFRAAELYARSETSAIVYCLGITQHRCGVNNVRSLATLSMLCGQIGRPCTGVNPLRGQNNVQGACDMGAGPADFTGYQKVANPEMRAKFEAAWGVELNQAAGLKATECFPAMIDGRIRGLFLFGEDPVRTDPDTGHVIRALESLDFFVCEELFMTETAKYADVILPGRSYAEKEGTFTNTERRVQRVRKAVDGPAGARLDTEVFADIMRRMGYDQPTLTGAQLMDEVASLTPSYAGISHARLDSAAVAGQGLQWPCTGPDHPGTRIMHEGAFSRGLGGYSLAQYRPSAEQPDEEFPLIMMTGRVLAQYNAQAMTGRTEGLNQIDGTSFIEINDVDAAAAGIADGDRVRVSSRRGVIESTARVSGKTNPGEVWMPFHFQDGNANWLTNAALDNISATPEYKVCAVRVEKA
mgnify:CR=1 FL=1